MILRCQIATTFNGVLRRSRKGSGEFGIWSLEFPLRSNTIQTEKLIDVK